MIIPPCLKPGDQIAITCPSGYLDIEKTRDAVNIFKSWGLKVIIGKTVGSASTNYFSDTVEKRAEELQRFLDDGDIKAIMMGRGGYGMSQIIDLIDFSKFIQSPKWICGFSDITLLHNHLQGKLKIASLHSPMCAGFIPCSTFEPTEVIEHLRKCLMSEQPVEIVVPNHAHNQLGNCTGRLVGGNLAMVTHAIGSASQLNTRGCILFLEDIGEHLYKIDRMMYQLKRAGMLKGIKGLLFGYFSEVEDTTRPYGVELYELLQSHTSGEDYPVVFNFPAGHENKNFALKFGVRHRLVVTGDKTILTEI